MARIPDSTVVIGGGAAGIAAARRLHDAGHDVLLIEASDRLGGRAQSLTIDGGAAIDLGCGWLHSAERNPWTAIARTRGFDILTDTANWGSQWRDLGFPEADRQDFRAAWARWEAATHAALDGPDQPLSAFIGEDDRWRPMIDAISGYANGAPLASVSLHDWASYEDSATDDNWAVSEGYATLIVDRLGDVRHRLSTVATRIDHRGAALRIETLGGTIEAGQVIVCVPTSVLASGALVFDPPLPDKTAAAIALPLGLADKAFLTVDGPVEWPDNAHLMGRTDTAFTASHRLSPLGLPLIESFFGGACAEALEDRDAAAFAIDELVALLGGEWRRRLRPLVTTRWRRVPHIHGSYSHARIGHATARATLALPVDDRLFFAGEAYSTHDFSTAHGAYETGVAAADAIVSLAAAIA